MRYGLASRLERSSLHGAMDTCRPEDYFDAGLDLLAQEGPTSVTIARLCHALGVTKGSFYHHFSGIPEFLRRLLGHWEAHELALMAEAEGRAPLDHPTEVAKLAATWSIRHEAETAIRALGRTDATAAETQQRVDLRREDTLTHLFIALGIEPGRSRVLARVGMAILIGTQQRDHPVDRHRLEEMLGEYQRWVEHAAATDSGVRAG